MAHLSEAGLEKDSSNVGVLKVTSGNVTKRLGTRRETRVTTQASKNTATTTSQMATQERHAEKFRIQEWKRKTMAEFAYELQVIRSTQTEEMEAQRQGFEMKLGMMGERLELCEAKASSLTDEIDALKGKGARSDQDLPAAKKKSAAKKAQTTSDIEQIDEQANEQVDEQVEESENREISAEDESLASSQNQAHKACVSASVVDVKKRIQKQSYAAVASSTPVKIPEQP